MYNDKINKIIELSLECFDITEMQLRQPNRNREVVDCRHCIAFIIIRNMPRITQEQISKIFDRKNRASIPNNKRVATLLYKEDENFKEIVDYIESEINK